MGGLSIIEKAELGIALNLRGKVGESLRNGQKFYGKVRYGKEEPIWGPRQYGDQSNGGVEYGFAFCPWGIYQMMSIDGEKFLIRRDFYSPSNPQTAAQQANRGTFSDAVAGWQSLTDAEKKGYNKRAQGKNLSGYNLYISEYMRST